MARLRARSASSHEKYDPTNPLHLNLDALSAYQLPKERPKLRTRGRGEFSHYHAGMNRLLHGSVSSRNHYLNLFRTLERQIRNAASRNQGEVVLFSRSRDMAQALYDLAVEVSDPSFRVPRAEPREAAKSFDVGNLQDLADRDFKAKNAAQFYRALREGIERGDAKALRVVTALRNKEYPLTGSAAWVRAAKDAIRAYESKVRKWRATYKLQDVSQAELHRAIEEGHLQNLLITFSQTPPEKHGERWEKIREEVLKRIRKSRRGAADRVREEQEKAAKRAPGPNNPGAATMMLGEFNRRSQYNGWKIRDIPPDSLLWFLRQPWFRNATYINKKGEEERSFLPRVVEAYVKTHEFRQKWREHREKEERRSHMRWREVRAYKEREQKIKEDTYQAVEFLKKQGGSQELIAKLYRERDLLVKLLRNEQKAKTDRRKEELKAASRSDADLLNFTSREWRNLPQAERDLLEKARERRERQRDQKLQRREPMPADPETLAGKVLREEYETLGRPFQEAKRYLGGEYDPEKGTRTGGAPMSPRQRRAALAQVEGEHLSVLAATERGKYWDKLDDLLFKIKDEGVHSWLEKQVRAVQAATTPEEFARAEEVLFQFLLRPGDTGREIPGAGRTEYVPRTGRHEMIFQDPDVYKESRSEVWMGQHPEGETLKSLYEELKEALDRRRVLLSVPGVTLEKPPEGSAEPVPVEGSPMDPQRKTYYLQKLGQEAMAELIGPQVAQERAERALERARRRLRPVESELPLDPRERYRDSPTSFAEWQETQPDFEDIALESYPLSRRGNVGGAAPPWAESGATMGRTPVRADPEDILFYKSTRGQRM